MSDYPAPMRYKTKTNLSIREKMTPLSSQRGIVPAQAEFDVISTKDTALDPGGRVRDRWALRPDGYYCAVIYGGVVNAELVKSSATPAPATPPPPTPAALDEAEIRQDEIDIMLRWLSERRSNLGK